MRVALLNDRPDHPMLSEVGSRLEHAGHEVFVLDEASGTAAEVAREQKHRLADIYLCKSHSAHALEVAERLESLGACVINAASATAAGQDRVWMATRLRRGGIPSPATRVLAHLSDLRHLKRPVVVKSQLSRRDDLVAWVATTQALTRLLEEWPDEPVVVQTWIPNSGWDLKLWVVGTQVYAARRPTPLELPAPAAAAAPASRATITLSADQLSARVLHMALAVGVSFGLEIYGVDVISGPQGPLVVDVNPFPGARGIPGVAEAIVELAVARAGRSERDTPALPANSRQAHILVAQRGSVA